MAKATPKTWDENGDYIPVHSPQWYLASYLRKEAREDFMETPDETLNDVMWEIAEAKEQRDLVDIRHFRQQIEHKIESLSRPAFDPLGERRTVCRLLRSILKDIDALAGR